MDPLRTAIKTATGGSKYYQAVHRISAQKWLQQCSRFGQPQKFLGCLEYGKDPRYVYLYHDRWDS